MKIISGLRSLDKELDEPCVNSRSKLAGICTKYNDCDHENVRKLSICSYAGRIPVVCCPSQETVEQPAVIIARRVSDLSKQTSFISA